MRWDIGPPCWKIIIHTIICMAQKKRVEISTRFFLRMLSRLEPGCSKPGAVRVRHKYDGCDTWLGDHKVCDDLSISTACRCRSGRCGEGIGRDILNTPGTRHTAYEPAEGCRW